MSATALVRYIMAIGDLPAACGRVFPAARNRAISPGFANGICVRIFPMAASINRRRQQTTCLA
jgi:hypothetical protein